VEQCRHVVVGTFQMVLRIPDLDARPPLSQGAAA
jgi:hypothetical protein